MKTQFRKFWTLVVLPLDPSNALQKNRQEGLGAFEYEKNTESAKCCNTKSKTFCETQFFGNGDLTSYLEQDNCTRQRLCSN